MGGIFKGTNSFWLLRVTALLAVISQERLISMKDSTMDCNNSRGTLPGEVLNNFTPHDVDDVHAVLALLLLDPGAASPKWPRRWCRTKSTASFT